MLDWAHYGLRLHNCLLCSCWLFLHSIYCAVLYLLICTLCLTNAHVTNIHNRFASLVLWVGICSHVTIVSAGPGTSTYSPARKAAHRLAIAETLHAISPLKIPNSNATAQSHVTTQLQKAHCLFKARNVQRDGHISLIGGSSAHHMYAHVTIFISQQHREIGA